MTWLAAGLDPNTAWFYRQSDIPEILELSWLFACIAGKGLLHRAIATPFLDELREAVGLRSIPATC